MQDLNNLVVGANEDGYHLINVNVGRDFNVDECQIHLSEGEKLSDGSGVAHFAEGIEVSKYSNSIDFRMNECYILR